MKKIRDFIYNTNDILLVLIILVVAAGVIMWRMEAIMAYPSTLISGDNTVIDNSIDNDQDVEPLVEDTIWLDGVLAKDVTVTIKGGNATDAVQSLIDAELFDSYDDYAEICDNAGLTPENIHAQTYVFAAGSTQTDIASTVTN